MTTVWSKFYTLLRRYEWQGNVFMQQKQGVFSYMREVRNLAYILHTTSKQLFCSNVFMGQRIDENY
jgi:hypothetical protein